jgi:CBS domain containing-hemolysin-like protein
MKIIGVLQRFWRRILFWAVERNIHSKADIVEIVGNTSVLPKSDKALVLSALKFPEVELTSIMIPKAKIAYIRETAHLGPKVLDELYATGQKVFPVAHSSLDDTVGVIFLADITEVAKGEQTLQQATHLRPPVLQQNLPINQVLAQMLEQNANLALVADAGDQIIGMVELPALLETLFGRTAR